VLEFLAKAVAVSNPLELFPVRRPPAVPEGIRVYAVGDIHGRADLLEDVLLRIDADLKRDRPRRAIQIFLGDYVDRGPHSRKVIEILAQRREEQELICLKGNHEDCLLGFLRDPSTLEYWSQLGGIETLKSYGVLPGSSGLARRRTEIAAGLSAAIAGRHEQFLRALDLTFSLGDFFFVHAGVNPNLPLSEQRESDLLWIRAEFLNSEKDFGKMIVHGHTPTIEPEVRTNRIGIDTGAFATNNLTCLIIEGDALALL